MGGSDTKSCPVAGFGVEASRSATIISCYTSQTAMNLGHTPAWRSSSIRRPQLKLRAL
jgi:hypothetical protein